jgi:CMP-N-acetylneuraminic acid synthetase
VVRVTKFVHFLRGGSVEKHIAIVPARAGSKTIKDKNLIRLGNRNLVGTTVKVARDSKIFSKIVVSSDYPRVKLDIEDIGRSAHTEVVYLPRPRELTTDSALMIDVIKSVLKDVGGNYTWVWLFQPTSPFRNVNEIKKIKKVLDTGDFEAAISFKPIKEFSDRMYTWKNGVAHKITHTNFKNKQDITPKVMRSGNYYVIKKYYIDENKDSKNFDWAVKPFFSYIMGEINPLNASVNDIRYSRMLGVNIDDREDLELAKGYVRRGDVSV